MAYGMSSCHCSMIRVFQCEDSLTGILTGVYDAWDSRLGHENVRLSVGQYGNMELFCEYERAEPDAEKAGKVFRTVQRRMGEEACEMIAQAAAFPCDEKADAVYRMIVLGINLPDGRKVTAMLSHPQVRLIFELSRKVWHIAHRYMGFVRFSEMENGVLFARIGAEADILTLVAPHFADRLPREDWLIYDEEYRKAVIHPGGQPWFLLDEVDEASLAALKDSGDEERFRKLWKGFHRAIGVESRANRRLQMSVMPVKFRKFMTEWT